MNLQTQKLLHSFEELYLVEKAAHDLYEKQLMDNLSAHEREVIQGIHDDEERHMKIVTKIINLIKSET